MATKHSIFTAGILAAVLLTAGCMSLDDEKFSNQVEHWVPVGTSEKDAERIMAKHGFECVLVPLGSPFNGGKTETLDCTREYVYGHTWTAQFKIADEKVIGYGNASVD